MLGAIEHPMGATQTSRRIHAAPRSSRRGGYVGQLKRELGVAAGQGKAWASFAASLGANTQRMSATADTASQAADDCDLAFGGLQDRVAALAAMQIAAADLFAVLTPAQRDRAARLLPLCCLPTATH